MSKPIKRGQKTKFFRLCEGASMYGMSENSFAKLVKEAGARYEVHRMVLVNQEILDQYLESCRVVE